MKNLLLVGASGFLGQHLKNFYQNDLFNVVAKYFILSSVAITSSELFYFFIFGEDIIGWQYGRDNVSNYILYATWIAAVIDCVVNVYCIFLNLEFASVYYRTCCHGLHSCIKLYCISITKRRASKQAELKSH